MSKAMSNMSAEEYLFRSWSTRRLKGVLCPEWKISFEAFESWAMKNGFALGMRIMQNRGSQVCGPDTCKIIPVQKPGSSNAISFADAAKYDLAVRVFTKAVLLSDADARARLIDRIHTKRMPTEWYD